MWCKRLVGLASVIHYKRLRRCYIYSRVSKQWQNRKRRRRLIVSGKEILILKNKLHFKKLEYDCDAPKPGGPVDNLSTRGIPVDFG